MRDLERYIKRIFIPFAAVAILAFALRWIMAARFAERNVRVAESESPAASAAEDAQGFSPARREALVGELLESAAAIDAALAERAPEGERAAEAQRARADLHEALGQLRRADASNWRRHSDRARDRLDAYAKAAGR